MKVFWPWEPSDEEIMIIIALHDGEVEVMSYDGEMVASGEMELAQMIKENPGDCVYASNSAIPVLVAALAGLPLRILEVDEDGNVDFVYEFKPSIESSNSSNVQLTRVWPQTSIAQRRRALQPH